MSTSDAPIDLSQFEVFQKMLPLAIGIIKQLSDFYYPMTHERGVQLSEQLRAHTNSEAYHNAVIAGTLRFNLAGTASDPVFPCDKLYSERQLNPSTKPFENVAEQTQHLKQQAEEIRSGQWRNATDAENWTRLGLDCARVGPAFAERNHMQRAPRDFNMCELSAGSYPQLLMVGEPPIIDEVADAAELLSHAEFYVRNGQPAMAIVHTHSELDWGELHEFADLLGLAFFKFKGVAETWYPLENTQVWVLARADESFTNEVLPND